MKRVQDSGFRGQGKGKKKSPTPDSNSLSFWHPASLISTCFGVGKIPFAPGTFGSLVTFPILFLLMFILNVGFYIFPIFYALTVLGVFSTAKYMEITGRDDPKEVVVDEVIGQFIAIAIPVASIAYFASGSEYFITDMAYLMLVGLSFVTFRFFDIVKPGPVGWADRNVKGAWGVMLDDIIAGVLAGITSALVFLVL